MQKFINALKEVHGNLSKKVNEKYYHLKIALTLDGKWYGAENMFSSEVFILAKESKDNSFCHCDNPRLVTRKVLFNTYQYCLICRKEKI
jgi:hypothetical protein